MNVPTSSSNACGPHPQRVRQFLVCVFCGSGIALAALSAAQLGCASSGNEVSGGGTGRTGLFAVRAERKAGPQPESEWNRTKLWRRVGDSPATYIPRAYSVTASRSDSAGKWFVDSRDGKRLFAPRTSVGGLTPGVLEGEAYNATHWQYGHFREDPRVAGEDSPPAMRKLPEPVIGGG